MRMMSSFTSSTLPGYSREHFEADPVHAAKRALVPMRDAKLHLPICLHVNCGRAAYWSELLRVLYRYHDLKLVIPHFALSTRAPDRSRRITFPTRSCSARRTG